MGSVKKGLDQRGQWNLMVDTDFNPLCSICQKGIDTSTDFYYCNTKEYSANLKANIEIDMFWCYNDRPMKWPRQCENEDYHNHYCIKYIEVLKDDKKKNRSK